MPSAPAIRKQFDIVSSIETKVNLRNNVKAKSTALDALLFFVR